MKQIPETNKEIDPIEIDVKNASKNSKEIEEEYEDDEDDDIDDFEVEFTTRQEYFDSSLTLINIAETMNCLTHEDNIFKKKILQRSYKIIERMSAEMYDELFDDREEIESEY